MKILIAHNTYQQPGGEDTVVRHEAALLRRAGHEVVEYSRSNHEIPANGNRLRLARRTIWAEDTRRELGVLIRRERPEIAHFHNTLFMISPAAYQLCQKFGVPVVQTLHNYRLLCPAALFYRNGGLCEACAEKFFAWPGILHACYRRSRAQTAVVSTMLAFHRLLGTWQHQIDCYIALTGFLKDKLVHAGWPESRIAVKPNFVSPDPGVRAAPGEEVVFIGRLSPEKGIATLLQAWQHLPGVPLKIIGDGPLRREIQAFISEHPALSICCPGRLARDRVFAALRQAKCLVFPSACYEGFPMTIIEAFACGVPVIASALGPRAEMIEDGKSGLLFEAGNAGDLVAKIRWALDHPAKLEEIGAAGRREFEKKYTAEKNYESLMGIYSRVLQKRPAGEHTRPA